MPQVAVIINGKTYRMACDDGQEQHLMGLAQKFDSSVAHLKDSFGEIGDQRLTVMAGIMITDELAELQKKMRHLEEELAALKKFRDNAESSISDHEGELVASLDNATSKMIQISKRLQSSGQSAVN